MPVVIYEKKDRIAYITLNRPDKLNAISDEMVDEMQKVWVDFREDPDLWVAVVSGNGRAFCAGADVTAKKPGQAAPVRTGPPPDVLRSTSKATLVAPVSYEIWKPIICAVHGYVYGAGAWLALTCDLRVAAEDAQLGLPEVKMSRAVNFAGMVSQYLPLGIARELLLWGDPMDARRAYELGIFNRVVPAADLMPTATALAKRVLENGPLAVRATKEVILRGMETPTGEGKMVFAEKTFAVVTASEDFREGVTAFKEKRKPVWKAR